MTCTYHYLAYSQIVIESITNQPRLASGLEALKEFGRDAELFLQPAIAIGGFVVPGGAAVWIPSRFKEKLSAESSSAGPAASAGARQASAASQAARPIGTLIRGEGGEEYGELVENYPDAHTAASSPTLDIITMKLGLFEGLSNRARLFLEIPRFELAARYSPLSLVPPIRAWAFWDAGAEAGLQITSHHENPDGSICACMIHDWRRGQDLVVDYVNFCVCWIAKILHDQLIGFYPGRQHLPDYLRKKRDRAGEFCGCGQPVRYRDCHRDADLQLDPDKLRQNVRKVHLQYFAELREQHRAHNPLQLIGRTVSPNAC